MPTPHKRDNRKLENNIRWVVGSTGWLVVWGNGVKVIKILIAVQHPPTVRDTGLILNIPTNIILNLCR